MNINIYNIIVINLFLLMYFIYRYNYYSYFIFLFRWYANKSIKFIVCFKKKEKWIKYENKKYKNGII